MRPRGILADIGPGATGGIVFLTVLAGAKAGALLLIAESIAGSISAIASGHGVSASSVLIGAAGVLLRAIASWGTTVVAGRIAARAKRVWRERLTDHVATVGTSGGAEDVLLATRGLDDLDGYLGTVLPAVVAAIVIPVGLGLRILIADPLSALIIAVTLPLIPVFMILIGMHSRERADAAAGALTRLADHLVELAEGLPVLVGLGRAGEQTAALAVIQDQYRRRLDRAVRTALLSALALELVATLSVAVVAVTLGIRLLSGAVGLDVALVVLLLAPDCFSAIREVGAAYHQAQDGAVALRRLRGVLDRVRAMIPHRPGSPALLGLAVEYPGRAGVGPVTCRMPRTGVVAFDGPSGSGKSTLLDAIAGLAAGDAVVSGTITGLDGADIAMARQAPRFAGSTAIEELELVGSGHLPLLAELGLIEVADAPVGRLSPGEQRRLAVARALARVDAGATVLLLDEPTAHLDDGNAALVMAAVERRRDGVLIVLASHERRVRELADRVIELPGAGAGADAVARPKALGRPQSEPTAKGSSAGAAAAGNPQPAALSTAGIATRWALAVLLSATASGMAIALSAVSGWLIVRAAQEPEIMYLLVAIVGVRFFGLGRAVARYAERVVSHGAALRVVDDVRLRLWRRLADLGAGAHGAWDAGQALELLVNLPAQLRDLLPRVIPPLAGGSVVTAASALVVVALAPGAWGVACLILVSAVAAPVAAWLADRRGQRRGVATRAALTGRFAALVGAADDLRANASAGGAVAGSTALGRIREKEERRQAVVASAAGVVAVVGTGTAAVLAPLVSPSAAMAAVVSLLALACLEPIVGCAVAAQRLPALREVIGRLRAGFGAEAPVHGPSAAPAPVRRLALLDVSLGWEQGRPLVTGLDAELAAPGWSVIDGPSGSGKTTLVTTILGDLDPVRGAVEVDGADLRTIDREAWRQRIAWCPQEAHIFDSTLRANLLVARPRSDAVQDSEMLEVLSAVGLAHLVRDSAGGLGLRVGRRGAALSGGERQRVAVARALLRRCDVLVLDEPTAHLDEATAGAMMDDLRRALGDRIVLLVSHRRSDRRESDRVIALDRPRSAAELSFVA